MSTHRRWALTWALVVWVLATPHLLAWLRPEALAPRLLVAAGVLLVCLNAAALAATRLENRKDSDVET